MFGTLITLLLMGQIPETKALDKGAATPEQAVRTFIVAMMTKDAPTLRAIILPTKDFDTLLEGQEVAAEELEKFKAQIAKLPVRLLKAGEEVSLAGGGKYKVQAKDISPDRAVALPEGASFPVLIQKDKGQWRIDASPIIANMKGDTPKPLDPAQIKDKITIHLDQKLDIQFNQKGNMISEPKVVAAPKLQAPTVHMEFSGLDDKPTLSTQNPFTKDLSFRALARHKGRKSYFETSVWPVKAGISGIELWQEPIEELVLFDFKLVDETP